MLENTKKFCDSFLQLGVPGFDLLVFQHGKSVLRYSNGYSDIETQSPINGKERYNIYSCSKPITCTAAMQLWEKGLFSLDDELSRYLPEFSEMYISTPNGIKKAENPILIKHLFEMSAGFSYNCCSEHLSAAIQETGGRCPTREAMKYLARDTLSFEPGERWQYSLCHDVLAALVEVISKEKFEIYVKKNIFDVLGMKNSSFLISDDECKTITTLYRFENEMPVKVDHHIIPYKIGSEYASGGAGAVSTVDDYMKFLEGLRTNKLLKSETVKLMATNRLDEVRNAAYWLKETHGYGLGIRCSKGEKYHSDFGWDGAAGAYLALDAENEISIYFGCHLLGSPAQTLYPMIYRIVRAELEGGDDFQNICEILKTRYNHNISF